jgi:hypothetical protein
MREISSILGGIGLLIFGYLVISNASAANTIVSGVSSSGVNLITALQGKGSSGISITG